MQLKTQLTLCPMSYKDVVRSMQFGSVQINECNFELDLLADNKSENLPQDANAFFELYIEDSKGTLQNIPVLITNFKDGDTTPNDPYNVLESKLFRRFFVYDTISGIESSDGLKNQANAKVIRYASTVRLTVELNPLKEERIRVPVLTITYEEMKTNLIQ